MNEEEKKEMTKREIFLAKMKERMPDVDFESEDSEVRYGAFDDYDNQMIEQMNKYKENDDKLKELFSKDPKFASFVSEVVGGGSVAPAFTRLYGKDILDMSDDEESMKAIQDANQEYLNRVAESNQLKDEQQANMEKSAEDMSAFKQEKGMSDEDFEKFISACYDVVEGALIGKIDKSFLETMYKGLNYEKDIQDAADAGVIEGRNQKIDETLKKRKGDGIPNLNSGSKGGERSQKINHKRDFYS